MNKKPNVQERVELHFIKVSVIVNNQVYTLIPVGIAITIVAAVK
jgi:hypothetical protein